MEFNTQLHICSLLGCLSCSVAWVPWLAWVPQRAWVPRLAWVPQLAQVPQLAWVSQLAHVPQLAGLALVAWLLRCLAGAWGLQGGLVTHMV